MLIYLLNELFAIYMLSTINIYTQNITEFASNHIFLGLLFAVSFSLSIDLALKDLISKYLLMITTLLLISALSIPYHMNPFFNQVHSILGFSAVFLLLLIITYYIYIFYNQYFTIHCIFLFICILVFVHYAVVNGILELLIITYVNLFLMIIKRKS